MCNKTHRAERGVLGTFITNHPSSPDHKEEETVGIQKDTSKTEATLLGYPKKCCLFHIFRPSTRTPHYT